MVTHISGDTYVETEWSLGKMESGDKSNDDRYCGDRQVNYRGSGDK